MLYTRCPHCRTTFRTTAEILRLAEGQVRCGRCDIIFNGFEYLTEQGPMAREHEPQPETPTETDGAPGAAAVEPDDGPETMLSPETEPAPDSGQTDSEDESAEAPFEPARTVPDLAFPLDAETAEPEPKSLLPEPEPEPSLALESASRVADDGGLLAELSVETGHSKAAEGGFDAGSRPPESREPVATSERFDQSSSEPETQFEIDFRLQATPTDTIVLEAIPRFSAESGMEADIPEPGASEAGAEEADETKLPPEPEPTLEIEATQAPAEEAEFQRERLDEIGLSGDDKQSFESAQPGTGQTEIVPEAPIGDTSAIDAQADYELDFLLPEAPAETSGRSIEPEPGTRHTSEQDGAAESAQPEPPEFGVAPEAAPETAFPIAAAPAIETETEPGQPESAAPKAEPEPLTEAVPATDAVAEPEPERLEDTPEEQSTREAEQVAGLEPPAAEPHEIDEPGISENEADVVLEVLESEPVDIEAPWSLKRRARPQRVRTWRIAAVAALLVLAVQAVHHFRAELAAAPLIGASVRGIYDGLGYPVRRFADPRQYEVVNWETTAQPGGGEPDSLLFSAAIESRGDVPLEYPVLRLRLTDRWQQTVGMRFFHPDEYLASKAAAGSQLEPGASAQARLVLVDPGPDASGFEVDVCVAAGANEFTCRSDLAFQQSR